MDGVLFHGERALPGAADFLDRIASYPYLFITNNPILEPLDVVAKLERLGLGQHTCEKVLTSAEATVQWLSEQKPGFKYYAVGAAGLHTALSSQGIEDEAAADYVVVGEGAGIDYQSLTRGINLILKQDAQLVVTNPDNSVDAFLDGKHQVLPGGGSLVAPFSVATGVEPIVIGKPNPILYEMALERLGVQAPSCLMIGDRPDTDIAGAVALGFQTALVRSGRFAPGEAWPDGLPGADFDVENLRQLTTCLADQLASP